MRVWDLSPGYLSRQRLLGEHRELHGLASILIHGKTGYARHPETLRWIGCLSGLIERHALLSAEMALRGYVDRTPLARETRARWPKTFITPPHEQIALLRGKYDGRESGRIPLPINAQQLWAQHKYSVMARDPDAYRRIGRRVAAMPRRASMASLAEELVMLLRQRPARGRIVNALEHMWGYVADAATEDERRSADNGSLLASIQTAALRAGEPYLLASTALSELAIY